jgi:hypothetical protein
VGELVARLDRAALERVEEPGVDRAAAGFVKNQALTAGSSLRPNGGPPAW